MTVTLNDPIDVGGGAWLFTWTSDATSPTYRISKNGSHVISTTTNRVVLMCDPSDMIGITDDGSDPLEGADSAIDISWNTVAATDYYKVEKETSPGSGTFNIVARIKDDGSSRFSFKTLPLTDDTATVFRVTPIGTNGNAGTATSFNVTVPRHPSAPDVTYSFSDSTKKVTVAAS